VLVLLLVMPAMSRSSQPGAIPTGLTPYLVQMHIHGHSNHNGNDLPASMESQCYEAVKNGFDVIWWTDHEFLFGGFDNDIVVDFKETTFEPDSTVLVFAENTRRTLTRLAIDRPSQGAHLGVENGILKIHTGSKDGVGKPVKMAIDLASERGAVTLVNFCRPVTSGLGFRAWGRVHGLGEDTLLRIRFDFSWHPNGRHHAVFDIVRSDGNGPQVLGDTTVVENVGIGDGAFNLALDLEAALSGLPNGDDNTLSTCRIEIGARNGRFIDVEIDSLKFVSTKPDGENQYRTVERLAQRYRQAMGIRQYIGVEVGLLHLPNLPHMDAFLPREEATYENACLGRNMNRREWIKAVRDMGGVVSVNHPFGAALRPQYVQGDDLGSSMSIREISQRAGLVDESYFWRVARPIVRDGAWGADLLEVGYLFRGAGSLRDHLRLWDLVLANGVRLMGFGSSDSHGGIWGPDMEPNPFATWIWSASDTADRLLDAMRSGRMVFGDPFLWKSAVAFGVEDAFMGDTLFVGNRKSAAGWLYMDPWRNDVSVRLIQMEISKGDEPNILRSEVLEDPGRGFEIKVGRPCYVRLEIYDKSDVPLAFTNPVYIWPQ
jgi:hypothetical protein